MEHVQVRCLCCEHMMSFTPMELEEEGAAICDSCIYEGDLDMEELDG